MFCSICHKVEKEILECQRKICPVGHVNCEDCEDISGKCRECQAEISNFVCIQKVGNLPRLFILDSSKSQSELENQSQNSSGGSGSLLMQSLNKFEENDIDDCDKDVVGCFKVVAVHPESSLSISIDEEEQEILNGFKASTKSDDESVFPVKTSTSNKSQLLIHQAIQTSCYGEHESIKSSNHSYTESLCPLISSSKNISTSSYSFSKGNIESEIGSVFEFFKNDKDLEDSDTAHFTNVTVSSTSSPYDSPPKKGIDSIGYRVRFASVFNSDESFDAQMEPICEITNFELLKSSTYTELTRDSRRLPRFPVRCPITNCSSSSVPSDFCNHICIDHPYIDIRKIEPNMIVNMRINQMGNVNMLTCQKLFLLSGKVFDIGYGTFENCLPILLLTSRMSLRKAFSSSGKAKISDEYFFIYLVAVYQFPVNYTLTLWSHGRDDYEATMIKSISTSVHFMNKAISPKEIALSISSLELKKLTSNEKKMLSCQIVFH